jgi:hypothetical protein
MNSINIKKQITTVTTWFNDEQKQKIEQIQSLKLKQKTRTK